MNERTIAVIGAGTMGVGIAVQYALYGHKVALYSRSEQTLERARKTMEKNALFLEREMGYTPEEVSQMRARITCTTNLETAVVNAWYVVETIIEKAAEKQALYEKLDPMLPEDVILSSNTSYLDIFPLLPERRRSYAAIVHWFVPAHIMPLVEIVKGPETRSDVLEQLEALHRQCGKTVAMLERYVPGFLINRLQSAMTREMLFLLDNGYCTPETLDLAVKSSIMPRGMLLGLAQRADFAGLDMTAVALRNGTYQPAPAPGEDSMVYICAKEGRHGVKSGHGFYDYGNQAYEDILYHRDVQLIRSVRLAKELMDDPLHDNKEH